MCFEIGKLAASGNRVFRNIRQLGRDEWMRKKAHYQFAVLKR